jgi:hypothetical protein
LNNNIENNAPSHTTSHHHTQSFLPHTASLTATTFPPSHTLSTSSSYIQPERTHQSSRTDNPYPTSSSSLPSSTFSSGFTIFEERKSPKKENKKENRTVVMSEKKENEVGTSFSIFQDEEKKDEGRFLLSHCTQDMFVRHDTGRGRERGSDSGREKSATVENKIENENKYENENKKNNRIDYTNKSGNGNETDKEEKDENSNEKKNDTKNDEKEVGKKVETGDNDNDHENRTLDDILAQMGILDSEDGTINTRLARYGKHLIIDVFFIF